MNRSYKTERAAMRRVTTLKQRGIWPGVQRHSDGRYYLTYDPYNETMMD